MQSFFSCEEEKNVITPERTEVKSTPVSTVAITTALIESDLQDDTNVLDELDIGRFLVYKKAEEEGPDIRGGHPDALIIHATKANKNGESVGARNFLYEKNNI